MKFKPRSLALAIALISQSAWSAETLVHVLYDDDPLQGVDVVVDGTVVGETDDLGSAISDVSAGAHKLELQRMGASLGAVSFENSADEEVEIHVKFSSEDAEPVVTINRYEPGDQTKGTIGGLITTRAGDPIPGVEISLGDGEYSVVTDADGTYQIELPRGNYSVSMSHPDYKSVEIDDVQIPAEIGIVVSAQLRSSAPETTVGGVEAPTLQAPSEIEEVVIMGTYNPSDTSAGIERFATTVVDALDIGQLERFGDSNVAVALTRLVGVTVSDGRYANVRGLDGRYISSTLNGILMPSTDPLRRDVQLDLFPSNILGGIEIQKSYSADLLGTTTGGSVKMSTRGLPDERTFKFSLSGGYNSEVTDEEIVTYKSSNTDAWGYDSGLRELPSGVLSGTDGGQNLTICDPAIDPVRCTAPLSAAALGVQLQDDYNVDTYSADPDFSASAAYGDRITVGAGDFGFYGTLGYGHSTKDRVDAIFDDPVGLQGNYFRSQENYSLNGYFVTGYEYGDANEILSKTIYLHNTDNTTRVNHARDNGEEIDLDETILEWVEREFISQQILGSNLFNIGEGHTLDWRLGYSQTSRYEPDRRTYAYFNGFLSTSSIERRWSDLKEDSYDASVDYSIPLTFSNNISTIIKLGVLYSDKDRTVDLYRFSLGLGDFGDEVSLSINENIEDTFSYQNFALDRIRLAATTTDTDSYESTEETNAYYFTTETLIGDKWTLVLGGRQEDFTQELSYPDAGGSSDALESDEFLPALALNFQATEELQIRAGYSSTVSYPGIIERSDSLTYDPDTDRPIFGNPNLEVSTIDNYDVRFEYYFNDEENVTLAFFRKDIDKPIEQAIPDGSGSGASGITFRNSEEATLEGIELDAYKNLFETSSAMVFVSGNVSYIKSEVTLDGDSLRLEGANQQGRDLQGQAPWLANLQIGFDHFATEQKVTLLVNYSDDKIYSVSRGAAFGPEYENGRTIVNLNYEKLFGESLTIKAQLKNLLNEEVERQQNGNIIESYKEGISVSLGASYEF